MNFKIILLAIPKIVKSLIATINPLYFAWCVGWAIVAEFVQKFIFKDWDYLIFLVIPFTLDTIFGTWAAVKMRTFSIENFYVLIAKVAVYVGILVLGHNLSNFTVDGKVAGYGIIANGFYQFLIWYEGHSALKNMGVVYPKAAFIHTLEGWLYAIIESKKKEFKVDESPEIQP